MISALLVLVSVVNAGHVVAVSEGQDVGIKIVDVQGELRLEFEIKDGSQNFVVAAVSSTHPAAQLDGSAKSSLRTLRFNKVSDPKGKIVLSGGPFTCELTVPPSGRVISVEVRANAPAGTLGDALFGVALAPGGEPTRATYTFSPRGARRDLVTTEHFASPLVIAGGGGFGVALMPDVDDLAHNRPMPPVLQVFNDGRVSPAAILAYGFTPYNRDERWTPSHLEAFLKHPESLSWKFDLLLTREDMVVQEATHHLWTRLGAARIKMPLPQTVPFRYYTKPTFDLETQAHGEPSTKENRQGLWWVAAVGGKVLRAPAAPDGTAKLAIHGNLARFAWGLRWWGDELRQKSWSANADEVMNLVASAPAREGFAAVSFDLDTKSWREEPFDDSVVAHNARWSLKYAESFSHADNALFVERVTADARRLLTRSPIGVSALFLQEFASSAAVNDEPLKARIREKIERERSDITALAEQYVAQSASPSVEAVAIALFLVRDGTEASRRLALRLVQGFFLHQALWQPVTVIGTEIFGAFVGEHFSEEGQSEFSGDLLDVLITLGDKELSDRGVAALRAPLALFAHATHGISGMFLPEEVRAFQSTAWFGDRGQAEFGPWPGVAEGIGQTLASIAQVTAKYGSLYTHANGWTLGIDGLAVGQDHKIYSAFSRNPLAFEGSFPYTLVNGGSGLRTQEADPPPYPAMRSLGLIVDGNDLSVVALPGFTAIAAADRLSGAIVLGDETVKLAEFLPTGLGVNVTETELALGPVAFNGRFGDVALSVPMTTLLPGPPSADLSWPIGWRWMKGLSDVVRSTVSNEGEPVVSSADDGRGGRSLVMTGIVESRRFLLRENGLRFTMLGQADADVYIELVDAKLGVPVVSARKSTDEPEDVSWGLDELVGSTVVFRIVDESKTGSIEIKGLRSARLGPGG